MAYINKVINYSAPAYDWDSWAYSVETLAYDGYFIFKAYVNSAIICGSAEDGIPQSNNSIRNGFYLNGGSYRVIELGVLKTPAIQIPANAVFKIERTDGIFSYYVDDVLVYTSEMEKLFTEVRLYASMYGYMDSILDPEIVQDLSSYTATSENELPGLISAAFTTGLENAAYSFSQMASAYAYGEVDSPNYAFSELPGLAGIASTDDQTFCISALPSFESHANQGEVVVEICAAANDIPALESQGVAGEPSIIESELPALSGWSLAVDASQGTDVAVAPGMLPALDAESTINPSSYIFFDLPKFAIYSFGVTNIIFTEAAFSFSGDMSGAQTGGELHGFVFNGLAGGLFCGAQIEAALKAFDGEIAASVEVVADVSAEVLLLSGEAFGGGSLNAEAFSLDGKIETGHSANADILAHMPVFSGALEASIDANGSISGEFASLAGFIEGERLPFAQIGLEAFRLNGAMGGTQANWSEISGSAFGVDGSVRGKSVDLVIQAKALSLFGNIACSSDDVSTSTSLLYRRP